MGDKGESEDARLIWIIRQASRFLRFTMEEMEEQLYSEENDLRGLLINFLDGDLKRVTIFEEMLKRKNDRKRIVRAMETPSSLGSTPRWLVMVKLCTGRVSPLAKKKEIFMYEIEPSVLNHMVTTMQSVFLPNFFLPETIGNLPTNVAKDLTVACHSFISNAVITAGMRNGETVLPLPVSFSSNSPSMLIKDNDLVRALENCVVTWARQINEILKEDAGLALAENNTDALGEIDFWSKRAKNLRSVQRQMKDQRIRVVLEVLKLSQSTFHPTLMRMDDDVDIACAEATDNARYLAALRNDLSELEAMQHLEEIPMNQIIFRIPAIVFRIFLIWKHSRYYTTQTRLAVLFQQLNNLVIATCMIYLRPGGIFNLRDPESVNKLEMCTEACLLIPKEFAKYKDTSAQASKSSRKSKSKSKTGWELQETLLFGRLNAFLDRCYDLVDVARTVRLFSTLSRIEIGSTKGKSLTASLIQISADFDSSVSSLLGVKYDLMDVDASGFHQDFFAFRSCVKELERRLSSILTQSFEDSLTIESCYKLLKGFSALLQRDAIRQDLHRSHLRLLKMFYDDLNAVQDAVLQGVHHEKITVYDNLPPTAGSINWARSLLSRVQQPLDYLEELQLEHLFSSTDEGRQCNDIVANIKSSLQSFEVKKFKKWVEDVEETSASKLKQPLLRMEMVAEEPDPLLDVPESPAHARRRHAAQNQQKKKTEERMVVNFDEGLVQLLREVKYLLQFGLKVPEAALSIYNDVETFRTQTGNLSLIVNMYNQVLHILLPVERPLIATGLDELEKIFSKGLRNLTWKSHGINEFIAHCMSSVKEVHTVLSHLKANVKEIENIMAAWCDLTIFERAAEHTYAPQELMDSHRELSAKRQKVVSEGAATIHKLANDSMKLLDANRHMATWKAYLDHLSGIVLKGLTAAVLAPLQVLSTLLVNKPQSSSDSSSPLIEIRMELVGSQIRFSPELGDTASVDGKVVCIETFLTEWCESACSIGGLVRRLDAAPGEKTDYLAELMNVAVIKATVERLREVVKETGEMANHHREGYLEYSHLWTDDCGAAFKTFLEQKCDVNGEDDVSRMPALTEFDDRIQAFRDAQEKVAKLPNTTLIGWVRSDNRAMKQACATWLGKWSHCYTDYIAAVVRRELRDLHDFVAETMKNFEKDTTSGSTSESHVFHLMGVVREVKLRTSKTEKSLEPLKQMSLLLTKHNVQLPDETVHHLHDAPQLWRNLMKKTFAVKEKINPIRNDQVVQIKSSSGALMAQGANHKDHMKRSPLFVDEIKTNTDVTYEAIDEQHLQISELEESAKKQWELETLFELNLTDFVDITECRNSLIGMKKVCDMTVMVHGLFELWKATLWKDIDVDTLTAETKRLQKELRNLPREVREWSQYTRLEASIKNMLASLPLVQSLRSPAMRDRHWNRLMKITAATIKIDTNFCFADLLALNLHKFSDEVAIIVETANKEQAIEQTLTKISGAWELAVLAFQKHEETDVMMLKPNEQQTEMLEEHQVQLQNIMASRFVAFFQSEVEQWQRLLANVEAVISVWITVQRAWARLVAIFLDSADIREKLPEDTERFGIVNTQFREFMVAVQTEATVVSCCNVNGRCDELQGMSNILERCERSLEDYMEQKRMIFPRFYFVSPADLLEILSKGTHNPQSIMRHLPKCFDGISRLEFSLMENGEHSKREALGMHSPDGEYVAFPENFYCTGAVESWLQNLVYAMQEALRHILFECETRPQGPSVDALQTLLEFASQIVIVSSQISWTSEVDRAFDALEREGGESTAMSSFLRRQHDKLARLTTLVQGTLTSGMRRKIITLITIEVHQRDVVAQLVATKVDSSGSFAWQCELRYFLREKDCEIRIADAIFTYGCEYVGNCGRLVITPLTGRCYMTLTQSLRLSMGGAPAGPAGTGKTETTKDLGRGLGMAVYVFNCSEQMDHHTCANIFSGLAQSGAWGCFDEFNRISIEVLSVVSTQVKSILNAVKAKMRRFMFVGTEINLNATVGMFITMNPGYAGRTELPENLKALFRPVAMIVPDFESICEIMLYSEGFVKAKELACKFVTLYKLNRELLSAQDHYDWGLRAIKSVLVVAGSFRRAEPNVTEELVLMRALRDLNLPKIVSDDTEIFLGLVSDLFPKMVLARSRDDKLEAALIKAARTSKLQADDAFILKGTQLQELLAVRHSVFILGPAGCGKSAVWKTLAAALTQMEGGHRPMIQVLNPKAVTTNELYGCMHPVTREWKDGLLSIAIRNMSELRSPEPKWVMMDGDIDPNWIESMNSVMDDSKILTLASNERISLSPTTRLVFEIGHLRNATPATVSRAGILFINAADVGWRLSVSSWLEEIVSESTSPQETKKLVSRLEMLCDQYFGNLIKFIVNECKPAVPVPAIGMIHTTCHIIDAIRADPRFDKRLIAGTIEAIDPIFWFATAWGFGGSLVSSRAGIDIQKEFSVHWKKEFPNSFPDAGTVFDYTLDLDTFAFTLWSEQVVPYTFNPENPFHSIVVATTDTVRLSHLIGIFLMQHRPVLVVGPQGTGKTTVMQHRVKQMPEDYISVSVNLNSLCDAHVVQLMLEQPLEKKAGRVYGPPGMKKVVYVVDDINMPLVDDYGTQSALALIRQHMDYGIWYDRSKMTAKEIHNVQYAACMNPTAGSFTIDERLQRHFAVFACAMSSAAQLQSIYNSILDGHLQTFGTGVKALGAAIVQATLDLHRHVSETFTPTAAKFFYQFSMRDLSNVIQGLCRSTFELYTSPLQLVRLWIHECDRVYGDRLATTQDIKAFSEIVVEVAKKYFEDLDQAVVTERPNVFAHFGLSSSAHEDNYYVEVKGGMDALRTIVYGKLEEHNEVLPAMHLVLFDAAVEHVCRIARVLSRPRGSALLIGVGGSGKQSISRLAAFICEFEVFQIAVGGNYGANEFKQDLISLYSKAGIQNTGIVFLLNDGQITHEEFLVMINDLLSSGEVTDMYTKDDRDGIMNSVRGEVKQLGIVDTNANCWEFFIERVRTNLHMVMCMSPVGPQLRQRARRFPALIACTTIDLFHPWPKDALVSVANSFLEKEDFGGSTPEERAMLHESITLHIAFVHESITAMCSKYLERARRYNYTTPKSFLEMLSLYKSLLRKKREETGAMQSRMEGGLSKLAETEGKVSELQEALKVEQAQLDLQQQDTDKLLAQVSAETEVAEKQRAVAREEEEKASEIANECTILQNQCQEELVVAEPAMLRALEALKTLDKKSLTEMKSFTTPPQIVELVAAAVMILTSLPGKLTKDNSWGAAKRMMANVDRFLTSLINFDKDNIPPENLVALKPYLENPNFSGASVVSKSAAAAGLCEWVVNIVAYYRVYQVVQPKREALALANARLEAATTKLNAVNAKIAQLEGKLAKLTATFEKSTEEKNRMAAVAYRTQMRLELAERLITGLADEKVRWRETLIKLKAEKEMVVGTTLLAAAFISYIGAFTADFRKTIVENQWMPDLLQKEIPIPPTQDAVSVLCSSSTVAQWRNEGLPTDQLSTENAMIITSCVRWPLIVDPQLQGIKWILQHEKDHNIVVIKGQSPTLVRQLASAITSGQPTIIEALTEKIPAEVSALMSRSVMKKGPAQYIRLGDREIEYNPSFKLYLQTRLTNPHYLPEVVAQATLINFSVTQGGLEEQLLATVVDKERPELEQERAALIVAQNEFEIKLHELEDALLARLSSAEGDIISDKELINNLETTKETAKEISVKAAEARRTERHINEARELYRPAAGRGSLLFVLVDKLYNLQHVYQFQLSMFLQLFTEAIVAAPANSDDAKRVENIVTGVTLHIFNHVQRGLFEKDKLIFALQLAISIEQSRNQIEAADIDFFLRGQRNMDTPNALSSWLPDSSWQMCVSLSMEIEAFSKLCVDLVETKRWKDWYELDRPEVERLPMDWKNLPAFQRFIVLKCLRPDRLVNGAAVFIDEHMGSKLYSHPPPLDIDEIFSTTSAAMPLFFILSEGSDPSRLVEELARKYSMRDRLSNVALGQGQQPIAEKMLTQAAAEGGWVMLQNIHLLPKWLPQLSLMLDSLAETIHPEFRLFLSAEPAPSVPVEILQRSFKITTEPPQGLQANFARAMHLFKDVGSETCTKEVDFRAILFCLCFFHAVIVERRKFGPQGWNKNYPFNNGDITVSAMVLANYLDANPRIPWDDLRFMFGEILYGGHITDDLDRRLCNAYLLTYVNEEIFDNLPLFPGFTVSSPMSHEGYMDKIENMPPETPEMFGMHPNVEIGFRLARTDQVVKSLISLQPGGGGGANGGQQSDIVKQTLDDVLERLPQCIELSDVYEKIEEPSCFTSVFIQEIIRLNQVISTVRKSLVEVDLALKGTLTLSDSIESIIHALHQDRVPEAWVKRSWATERALGSWIVDLVARTSEMGSWGANPSIPLSTWLSGFSNPQAFITAVLQTAARKNGWPLDRVVVSTEITKFATVMDISSQPQAGVFIHGLSIEGARWSDKDKVLDTAIAKQLYQTLPVINLKAIPMDKVEVAGVYKCPVYKTLRRGPTYVFTAGLKSKSKPSQWVIAGVAAIMDTGS